MLLLERYHWKLVNCLLPFIKLLPFYFTIMLHLFPQWITVLTPTLHLYMHIYTHTLHASDGVTEIVGMRIIWLGNELVQKGSRGLYCPKLVAGFIFIPPFILHILRKGLLCNGHCYLSSGCKYHRPRAVAAFNKYQKQTTDLKAFISPDVLYKWTCRNNGDRKGTSLSTWRLGKTSEKRKTFTLRFDK